MAITHLMALRTTLADVVADAVDAGATAGALIFNTSGDVEVATLAFADPAFGAASSAVATANAIVEDASATGGTIAKFRINDSNGLEVISGSVTVVSGGGDIELSALIIDALSTVSMTSLTYTAPV